MTSTPTVTLSDITAARERIRSGISHTPCQQSIPLSELTGSEIYCKLDLLQRTGSFKERGARNALLLLDDQQKNRGVIAASAGNHALGLAYHGGLLGIPVTVVMPKFAPLVKVNTCRQLGAHIVLEGMTFEDARKKANDIAQQDGLSLIHGFNDPHIIAGQGTMALEILDDVPDVEAIVVPTGGAGLLAGIAIAAKAIRPEIQIIAVEASASASLGASMAAGQPVAVPIQPTLADGLAVGCVGTTSYALAAPRVDRVLSVRDDSISLAVLRLLELEKLVVEGAAATTLAAMFTTGEPLDLKGRKTVLLLCGGNIDLTILDRVIDHGLVVDGRRWRFTAVISDRPGGIARLSSVIASTGASIREIRHERVFTEADVFSTTVEVTVETTDREHVCCLQERLATEGFVVGTLDPGAPT